VRAVWCLSHSGYWAGGWTKQDYSGALIVLSRTRAHASNSSEMSFTFFIPVTTTCGEDAQGNNSTMRMISTSIDPFAAITILSGLAAIRGYRE